MRFSLYLIPLDSHDITVTSSLPHVPLWFPFYHHFTWGNSLRSRYGKLTENIWTQRCGKKNIWKQLYDGIKFLQGGAPHLAKFVPVTPISLWFMVDLHWLWCINPTCICPIHRDHKYREMTSIEYPIYFRTIDFYNQRSHHWEKHHLVENPSFAPHRREAGRLDSSAAGKLERSRSAQI